jgi:dihydrofolate synthase/folylpolyglutamate synthase
VKTARYTSPHVSDFRERVSSGSGFFDEAVYIEAGQELVALEQALRATGGYEAPSFFEIMTMYFFLCARRADCEALVVETGMGGRLDATNIVTPLVSVITLIELEHTESLGNTIAAIAGEKAGIIKQGRPLILAEQTDEALAVFRESAAAKNAPFVYFPSVANIREPRIYMEGTSFTLELELEERTPSRLSLPLTLAIPGLVQANNAGLAILAIKIAIKTATLKTAFPALNNSAIQRGLAGFTMPARFERVSRIHAAAHTPPFIIDGAHTPHSIAYCAETFAALYGRGILLFGCVAGKDTRSMAKILAPRFSYIIITTPGSFKKSFPEEVFAVFKEEAATTASPAELFYIADTGAAIEKALALGLEKKMPVLGTGSFYLVADVRTAISSVSYCH